MHILINVLANAHSFSNSGYLGFSFTLSHQHFFSPKPTLPSNQIHRLSPNWLRTGQYGPALALLLHAALLLARDGEGHFEHEAANVVTLLEVRLSVRQLLLFQVRGHVRYLDVRILGVQVFGVNLQKEPSTVRRQVLWRTQSQNQSKESYLPGVLDHLHILLSKLVRIELEEPLRYLRQRGEFGLLVDVLLAIFILEEALWNGFAF